VDDGRDILAWVEVELLTEWGIIEERKRWGIEAIRVTTRVVCLVWDLPRYG
jgi:hypothetical protein